MALQVRRGTNAERLGITPLVGELIYVTDTKQLYVGDGTTTGGTTTIANTIDSLLSDTSPQLGGELDLNGNNITGTGNINITGTITASGTVNLGDGVGSDILVIGGAIQGHLVPDADSAHNLGSSTKFWNNAWIDTVTVDGTLTATSLVGNLTGNAAGAHTGTLDGDMTGSVFGDDSALLVDGNNNKVMLTNNTTDNLTEGSTNLYYTNARTQAFVTQSYVNALDVTAVALDGDMTGSVFSDNSTLMLDGINLKLVVEDISVQNISAPDNDISIQGNVARSRVSLQRNDTTDVASNTALAEFVVTRKNTSTNVVTGVGTLGFTEDRMVYVGAPGGTYDFNNYMTVHSTGKVAISMAGNINAEPAAHLEVGGAIKPGVYADNAARDAAIGSPVAGMMVFNTTGTKFQGYTGSAWVDLN
tara:strand:- start:935 stop:2185 length:1251 start_codon:yes stop_codon:yes gene_type:complete